jgi:hypothetical protein
MLAHVHHAFGHYSERREVTASGGGYSDNARYLDAVRIGNVAS